MHVNAWAGPRSTVLRAFEKPDYLTWGGGRERAVIRHRTDVYA